MELTSILSLVYAILGIGIIIFIHELGHFLAAKRVGVRVEIFCLGFDPSIRGRRLRLFSFRRGDTVYAIGAIPFGGYVKLAGETALERKGTETPPKSDELMAKPPGARALVFAMGALFNIISAFLFFILAFRIGVSFIAPVVGQMETGMPAWKAGIRPGDRILEINGKKVEDFHEILIASALGSPEEPRTFRIQRNGQILPPLDIVPAWSPQHGFHVIGITPAYDAEVRSVAKGGVADIAGIREGDRLAELILKGVRVQGPLLRYNLEEFMNAYPGEEFQVGLERAGEREILWKTIHPLKKPTPTPTPLLGVIPGLSVVEAVRPGSLPQDLLRPGDQILKAAGKLIDSMEWMPLREGLGLVAGPVPLEIRAIDGTQRTVTVDAGDLIRWSLERSVKWNDFGCRVAGVPQGSPFAAVLQKDDLVVAVGQDPKPVFAPGDFQKEISGMERAAIWRRRNGETTRCEVAWGEARGAVVEWCTAYPVFVLPGTPARRAGIQPGSRILEIDGRTIASWNDIQRGIRQAAQPKAVRVKWLPPPSEGRSSEAVIDLLTENSIENYDGLGFGLPPLQQKVQAGVLESFSLGAKRTVVVAENVFLTLKGLISRQVEAKNLAGPLGIIDLIYQVSEYGLGTLIYYLALISVNLGLFNLLPFPILDGGHLLFLAIEKVKGSPVDLRIQEIVTTIAVFLILSLAVFVTYNDLVRWISR